MVNISRKIQKKFIAVPDVSSFIAYHKSKPIGYIQWYDVAKCPIRNEQYPERTFGIDLFIADTSYIGKGYGSLLMKQFIQKQIKPQNPNKL